MAYGRVTVTISVAGLLLMTAPVSEISRPSPVPVVISCGVGCSARNDTPPVKLSNVTGKLTPCSITGLLNGVWQFTDIFQFLLDEGSAASILTSLNFPTPTLWRPKISSLLITRSLISGQLPCPMLAMILLFALPRQDASKKIALSSNTIPLVLSSVGLKEKSRVDDASLIEP